MGRTLRRPRDDQHATGRARARPGRRSLVADRLAALDRTPSGTLPRRGGQSLDDLSVVKTVQVPFDEQGGDLQRFDPELDDLADLSRDRLQSCQCLGPNRHQPLESPLRISRTATANGRLEPAADLFGHLEGTEKACSRPDTSGDP
jgi:hypothetical protein